MENNNINNKLEIKENKISLCEFEKQRLDYIEKELKDAKLYTPAIECIIDTFRKVAKYEDLITEGRSLIFDDIIIPKLSKNHSNKEIEKAFKVFTEAYVTSIIYEKLGNYENPEAAIDRVNDIANRMNQNSTVVFILSGLIGDDDRQLSVEVDLLKRIYEYPNNFEGFLNLPTKDKTIKFINPLRKMGYSEDEIFEAILYIFLYFEEYCRSTGYVCAAQRRLLGLYKELGHPEDYFEFYSDSLGFFATYDMYHEFAEKGYKHIFGIEDNLNEGLYALDDALDYLFDKTNVPYSSPLLFKIFHDDLPTELKSWGYDEKTCTQVIGVIQNVIITFANIRGNYGFDINPKHTKELEKITAYDPDAHYYFTYYDAFENLNIIKQSGMYVDFDDLIAFLKCVSKFKFENFIIEPENYFLKLRLHGFISEDIDNYTSLITSIYYKLESIIGNVDNVRRVAEENNNL